jgi:hypothetical protein
MVTPQTLAFAGGDVKPTPAMVLPLRESASDWIGLTTEHLNSANDHAVDGSLDTAVSQIDQAIEKLQRARRSLLEARAQESKS